MVLKVYQYLKSKGISVFFVGQHKGECINSYVVIKDGGINSFNGKVGNKYIDLLFYIPQNQFSKVEEYKKLIKDHIKEFGKLRYTGQETSIITDNDKKALTFSVLYKIEMKLEG